MWTRTNSSFYEGSSGCVCARWEGTFDNPVRRMRLGASPGRFFSKNFERGSTIQGLIGARQRDRSVLKPPTSSLLPPPMDTDRAGKPDLRLCEGPGVCKEGTEASRHQGTESGVPIPSGSGSGSAAVAVGDVFILLGRWAGDRCNSQLDKELWCVCPAESAAWEKRFPKSRKILTKPAYIAIENPIQIGA